MSIWIDANLSKSISFLSGTPNLDECHYLWHAWKSTKNLCIGIYLFSRDNSGIKRDFTVRKIKLCTGMNVLFHVTAVSP